MPESEKILGEDEGGHIYCIKKLDGTLACKCGCWYHLAYGYNAPDGKGIDPRAGCPKNPVFLQKTEEQEKHQGGESNDQPKI